ncbi:hypothetical protein RB597_002045 [Gaeumannomyces tritici]
MARAIQAVESGASVRGSARDWNVPRSTLRRRLRGGRTQRQAKELDQKLSKEQESFVANWICMEEVAGRAPTRGMVREFAQIMLPTKPEAGQLGKHWIDGFLSRNPTVITKVGRGLEAARAKETTKEAIQAFYSCLASQIAARNITPENICNMDETGLQEGESRAGRVVGSALTKAAEVKESDCTTWVTILEAVTATGARLTPVVVFTGLTLQAQWFPNQFPAWKYDHTVTGCHGRIILDMREGNDLLAPIDEDSMVRREGSILHDGGEHGGVLWLSSSHVTYLPALLPEPSHRLVQQRNSLALAVRGLFTRNKAFRQRLAPTCYRRAYHPRYGPFHVPRL